MRTDGIPGSSPPHVDPAGPDRAGPGRAYR